MTTPTPRELSADELAAIRERKRAYTDAINEFAATCNRGDDTTEIEWRIEDLTDHRALDASALLAHSDALAARCRAYEAALTDIDQLISYPEESDCERGDTRCLLDKVRKVAFDALLAATDGSGRDGNGEAR